MLIGTHLTKKRINYLDDTYQHHRGCAGRANCFKGKWTELSKRLSSINMDGTTKHFATAPYSPIHTHIDAVQGIPALALLTIWLNKTILYFTILRPQ